MKDRILSICLGNNSKDLSGCRNDAILMYNFLNYLNSNNNLDEFWLKPNILLDKNVVEDNIIKIIKENQERINKILIYYSGHGFEDGKINILNSISKMTYDTFFLKGINDVLTKKVELYIILDCCYSGSFKLLPFDNLRKINLISSSLAKQLASESLTSINNIELNKELNFDINNNNIITGVFTFNFINQLYNEKYKSINDWKKVFLNSNYLETWNTIERVAKQKPRVIW